MHEIQCMDACIGALNTWILKTKIKSSSSNYVCIFDRPNNFEHHLLVTLLIETLDPKLEK